MFISGYANTENVFYRLNIKYFCARDFSTMQFRNLYLEMCVCVLGRGKREGKGGGQIVAF